MYAYQSRSVADDDNRDSDDGVGTVDGDGDGTECTLSSRLDMSVSISKVQQT